MWPPTGVAIAAMLLIGYRATPGIALAAFLANYLLTPVGVVTAAGIATGNTLEAVTALFLLRIFVKQENFTHLPSVRQTESFIQTDLLILND